MRTAFKMRKTLRNSLKRSRTKKGLRRRWRIASVILPVNVAEAALEAQTVGCKTGGTHAEFRRGHLERSR